MREILHSHRFSPFVCHAHGTHSAAEILDAELFDALSRYRMDYRRHRMGAARGGELQKGAYRGRVLPAPSTPRRKTNLRRDQLLVQAWKTLSPRLRCR